MKWSWVFIIGILFVIVDCSKSPENQHPLDGKKVVLEGRWNGLAKEQGQIICESEPRVVDVIAINDQPKPQHNQLIRVTATIHWRSMTAEERKWTINQMKQGFPDGYVIYWSEAKWQPLNME